SLGMGAVEFSMMNFATWQEVTFSFSPSVPIIVDSTLAGALMGFSGGSSRRCAPPTPNRSLRCARSVVDAARSSRQAHGVPRRFLRCAGSSLRAGLLSSVLTGWALAAPPADPALPHGFVDPCSVAFVEDANLDCELCAPMPGKPAHCDDTLG